MPAAVKEDLLKTLRQLFEDGSSLSKAREETRLSRSTISKYFGIWRGFSLEAGASREKCPASGR
jgi:hypothetical protein